MTTVTADTPFLPAGLTGPQREAVLAEDAMLCVLAGAGAGKTRVLTLRVARRIADGSAIARHVLVCTFSRKAADELHRRLWHLGAGESVRAGTFHRTALALLTQRRAESGQSPPNVLSDRRSLIFGALDLAGSTSGSDRGLRSRASAVSAVSSIEAEIGWAKARLCPPEDYVARASELHRRTALSKERVAEVYQRYETQRLARGLLDLDDLLLACADLLSQDQRFAEAVRWQYRHLFVDEMQDVNPAQFRLLTLLLGDEPDLFVVGDPNQSVYGWNGADPSLLHRLPQILPGTRVVRLGENHRSSPQVVAVAAAALGLEGPASPTSTRSDGPIPRVVGLDSDEEEARFVAAELRRALRPGRRWSKLAVLARTNAQLAVIGAALEQARIPFEITGSDGGPGSDVGRELGEDDAEEDPGDAVPDVRGAKSGGDGEDAVSRRAPSDAVVLSTFHRAKGLQWPTVFVVGCATGLIPLRSARTEAAKDEERRLFYVALTRAESELTCTWARWRVGADPARTRPREMSPWLSLVDDVCRDLQQDEQPIPSAAMARHLALARASLRARRKTDQ
jgi:DNA helicase-2/ATP-dependent DNA helicase PcrA